MKNKYKGLFGEFSGRLGNLIIYELNGQTVIRTRPAGPQKKATGKRKVYQDDFSPHYSSREELMVTGPKISR